MKFKAFSMTFKAMYQEIQGPMGWKEDFRKRVKSHDKTVEIAENVTKTKVRRIQGLSSTVL